jgi:regulation of enolase protein 1 (concanavalin A-like superfamily)
MFQLAARVHVDFAQTFDAGVLLVWLDERTWAKLCLEYSPAHEPMVVSVVTRGVSDDCNSFVVPSGDAWLRVSRVGPAAFAFHASRDGERWELIRHFSLGDGSDPEVGFAAQSPRGEGCTATFTELRYAPERLEDIRSGR